MPNDAFLGTADHQNFIKSVSRDFLRPAVKLHKQRIGQYRRVHVHYVVPDSHFDQRRDILSLLSERPTRYYLQAVRTLYFKKFGSPWRGLRRIWDYRKMFNAIHRHGLRPDRDNPLSVPWLFASKETVYRLDGHHRASIARLLGYDSLEVLLFTPKDLLELGRLPAALRAAVARLHEPEVDLSRDPHGGGRQAAAARR